jgi:hydroxymethylbilane synthase
MEKIRITGRNSRLSLLQIEKVKQSILQFYPDLQVELVTKDSLGDQLVDIPLQTVEGTDFFTIDFFDVLENEEADIAVHSLKDMSAEHFFGKNYFAVVDRNDVRDVAIFNPEIEEKIANGSSINIGTCSPRRETMALDFLQKALPQLGGFNIQTKTIRGNVEARLQKLDAGEYDGIILATAGLNRLLESPADLPSIQLLLKGKRLMILPLFECVPAPCQGAIVAEALPGNHKAVEILQRINQPLLKETCSREKEIALQFGRGSMQEFGVMSLQRGRDIVYYSAGKDENGKHFEQWEGLPACKVSGNAGLFNATRFMGEFYDYAFESIRPITSPLVFVSNFKSIHEPAAIEFLHHKKLWASGTKTWLELAKKGLWVEGSADGLGMESLLKAWDMPLLKYKKSDVHILTNHDAMNNWHNKGWKASSTYALIPRRNKEIEKQVAEADLLFWTSYGQYNLYRHVVRKNAVHACLQGETASLLIKSGISPVLFPTIKSFAQWQQRISM